MVKFYQGETMVSYHNGDILESGCDIICHQVNLQGVMGGGIARQIADRFNDIEEQYNKINQLYDMRGNVHWFSYYEKGNHRFIGNCFSQNEDFTTNYEWLKMVALKIRSFARLYELKTIGIPFNYGCGIANGDWNKVEDIFKDVFEKENNIELQIWKL